MTKTDLIIKVMNKTGAPRRTVRQIVDATLDLLTDALSGVEPVSIDGLGVFTTQSRNSRVGRNPHTGEPVQIPARVKPYFRPSPTLQQKLDAFLLKSKEK